jgi:serine/threonine-protein kinase
MLGDAEAEMIEAHLDGCTECRRSFSAIGKSSLAALRQSRAQPNRGSTRLMFGDQASPIPEPFSCDIGSVVAGKYKIERLLGEGGMGVVMAARHVQLGKLVAIKVMRANLLVDPSAAQRFVREARAASRLRSEHIVGVIDLDTLPDGSPYMAMEYLEGEDLGALLQRGPITLSDAATYIVQVCDAIGEAHAAGIVHRDLKPANLFLTRRSDGSASMKVLDFGISKITASGLLGDELKSTETNALIGSPQYMAPEQLQSAKAADPRTDIWALGCILYELVSGGPPFSGNTLAELLASILRDQPPSLAARCTDLPIGFVRVVERCLEKDPARRYQSVNDLVLDLAKFVRPSAQHVAPNPVTQSVSPAVPRTARGRLLVIIASIAVVITAAALVFAVLTRRSDPTPAHQQLPASSAPTLTITPLASVDGGNATAAAPTTTPDASVVAPAEATTMPDAGPSHKPAKPHKPHPQASENDLLEPSL